jgi:predicted restriction endonuclease
MGRSKQAKAREFSKEARQEIMIRDRGTCLFCRMNYHMDDSSDTWLARNIFDIMHYIPRSQNGLGIAQNGVLGCRYHHEMLDNGNKGRREEMLEIMRGYLKSKYQKWDSEKLVYSKWRDI